MLYYIIQITNYNNNQIFCVSLFAAHSPLASIQYRLQYRHTPVHLKAPTGRVLPPDKATRSLAQWVSSATLEDERGRIHACPPIALFRLFASLKVREMSRLTNSHTILVTTITSSKRIRTHN